MASFHPRFLRREQIDRRHRQSLRLFGGADGIRSEAGLESAIAAPEQEFFYKETDVFEIAAAYAFHIAQAQAYVDGNKRTAAACALIFLEGNGVPTDGDAFPLYDALVAVAERRMTKSDLAVCFRELFGS